MPTPSEHRNPRSFTGRLPSFSTPSSPRRRARCLCRAFADSRARLSYHPPEVEGKSERRRRMLGVLATTTTAARCAATSIHSRTSRNGRGLGSERSTRVSTRAFVDSAIAAGVPPVTITAAAAVANPAYILGGIAALVLAAGGLVYSKDRASGSLISRLVREAEEAEETWGKIIAEEAETATELETSLSDLDMEWKEVERARRALEAAEAKAKKLEETSVEIRNKAQELRVKSAAAWIENWRAKQKLEGTLKITRGKK